VDHGAFEGKAVATETPIGCTHITARLLSEGLVMSPAPRTGRILLRVVPPIGPRNTIVVIRKFLPDIRRCSHSPTRFAMSTIPSGLRASVSCCGSPESSQPATSTGFCGSPNQRLCQGTACRGALQKDRISRRPIGGQGLVEAHARSPPHGPPVVCVP